MWSGNSLTCSPWMFLLELPRYQSLSRRDKGAFSSPKYWNKVLLIITYLATISRNFLLKIAKLDWETIHDKKENSFTHAHAKFGFFCWLWGISRYSCLNPIHTGFCYVYCYVMYSQSINYICFNYLKQLLVFSGYFPLWFLIDNLWYLTQ